MEPASKILLAVWKYTVSILQRSSTFEVWCLELTISNQTSAALESRPDLAWIYNRWTFLYVPGNWCNIFQSSMAAAGCLEMQEAEMRPNLAFSQTFMASSHRYY